MSETIQEVTDYIKELKEENQKQKQLLDILKEHIKLIEYCIFNDKIVIYLPINYREKLKEWLDERES